MFVAVSTWLQFGESRKGRRLVEYQISAELNQRVDHLLPELSRVLAVPEDHVEPDKRFLFVRFSLTYAQAWKAARLGLHRDDDWDGLRSEFAYWAEQPEAVRACAELRRTPEGWPAGFFAFVDAEVALLRRRRALRSPVPARPA